MAARKTGKWIFLNTNQQKMLKDLSMGTRAGKPEPTKKKAAKKTTKKK